MLELKNIISLTLKHYQNFAHWVFKTNPNPDAPVNALGTFFIYSIAAIAMLVFLHKCQEHFRS